MNSSPSSQTLSPSAACEIGEPCLQVVDHLDVARLGPFAIRLEYVVDGECHDKRLDGIERRRHPLQRAHARGGIRRDQLAGAFGDAQHDRARFEDRDLVVPVGRHLAERLEAAMFGGLRIGDQVRPRRLADFLEGPARAHVADKAAGELRNPAEGGDGWKHVTSPGCCFEEAPERSIVRYTDATSRPVVGEMPHQLVERAVPALLVAGPRRLGLQARMREGQLRPGIDRSQIDLDTRLFAGFLGLAPVRSSASS